MRFQSQIINCPKHLKQWKFHDCIHSVSEELHSEVARIESEKVESLEPLNLKINDKEWRNKIIVEQNEVINETSYNMLKGELFEGITKYKLCLILVLDNL